MSLLNGMLGQVSDNATVQNLADKVGLSPEQVEQGVTALARRTRARATRSRPLLSRPDCPRTSSRKLSATSVGMERWGALPLC
jgi:hypothetical protein